ncbi:transposase [Streptomyces sp. NPDC000070]|uniref:transposase n=1 Tax=Streptomyces sp. NPDC000070 TaxID=3154240 RepID=UPI0033188352
MINGVLFRARTGVLRPDLPERYGPWHTVYERHRRWSADGTWKAVLRELQIEADAGDPDGALACQADRQEWAVNIDSTSCRAHQHAAGAPESLRPTTRKRGRGA